MTYDLMTLAPKTRRLIKIMPSGCWEWQGHRLPSGHGNCLDTSAHRSIYKRLVGPVDPKLVLDHLCRNPPCVNPNHLEAVPQSVNMARSAPALATHCKRGHPFDAENTYVRPGTTRRWCKACGKERRKGYPLMRGHTDRPLT